jgi:transcriptional regulator with XRE-family HTH domain
MTPTELQEWRKQNGYSQSQLARALDVDSMTVSRWERGVRKIPSFLHLALECALKKKGTKTKSKTERERRVKKDERRHCPKGQ